MAKRKSQLQQIFSKALHGDDATLYTVVYRDFNQTKEVSLESFLSLSEEFSKIPAWRIVEVRRKGETLYRAKRG